ncbi:calcineurin-like phosphoesterase C-terminal domain-containing protein [Gracilimonas halophila]|uniref:Calcineurin-like phosphoesterase C-terminal domain-containing protein n=1 Tax=Gracilimonas halophila TaxID=1834464 RepID=A0ABW5JIV4_9BACT
MKFTTIFGLIGLFGLFSFSVNAQDASIKVSGTVFHDTNNNGVFDTSEEGISGIMISNQKDVTLSDSEGAYTLSLSPGQSLMVVKPSGYNVPLDEFNIPQFSHAYAPEGSPDSLSFGGLPATNDFPSTVNFPLTKAEDESTFNALAFGDPQPRNDQELDYVRDEFVNQAAGEDADFMMILGDIMYNDLSLFDRHKELMAQTDIPIWHVIGNHDLNFDTDDNTNARDTYKRQLGANYYAFQYGKVTFIALDNIDYQGEGNRPSYIGNIWGDQLTWLENLLPNIPEDHLIVLGTHIPIYSWGGETPNVNTLNRESLFELLEDRERVLSLAGHLHMTYHHFLDEKAGWTNDGTFHHLITTAVSGTWWGGPKDEHNVPITTQRDGNPNGYHRFTFKNNEYEEQLIGLNEDEDTQLRIETPMHDVTAADSLQELVVNVFNGNMYNKVWYRVNNSDWTAMRQENRPSPYYKYLLAEFSGDWNSSLSAIPTNHIWVADLSDLPNSDLYRFEVKTTDIYGKEWRITKVIEIK